MKNASFDTSKNFIGPVHLLLKTDKWDYLWSPIIEFFFVSCFDIREVPRSPGKWNWNRLSFLPFIFSFEQCDLGETLSRSQSSLLVEALHFYSFMWFQLSIMSRMKLCTISTSQFSASDPFACFLLMINSRQSNLKHIMVIRLV